MGSEWEIVSLDQVANMRNGAGVKQDFFSNIGVPLARVSDFTADSIDLSGCNFVEPEHAKKWSSHLIAKDDVIVATVGSWPPNWSSVVGKVVRAPISSVGAIQNQNTCCIVPDEKRLNNSFLYYRLKCEDFAWHAANSAGGSANQARLPVKKLSEFRFNLPSLEEQEYIARILGSLDNKISLNRQLNQTLEHMAQALFKSWFVDFDPVIDNALAAGNAIPDDLQDRAERRQLQLAKADHKPLPENIRKLFPSEFELTESLGWVPKGWVCKAFADVTIELRRGISPKYIESDGILVLNQKCIRDHDVNFSLGRRHDSASKSIDGRSLKLGDVLVNSTGVGTLGRVAQIKYLPEDAVVDSHVTVVRSNPEIYPAYTFAQQIIAMESEIEAMGEGSTGQTELSRKVLSEKYILLPSLEVLKTSEEYFINFAMKSAANIQSTEELANLRDTLLPKLISGELRIPEAQAQLEEALV